MRFQDFSLPGQPRDSSSPLAEILAAEGIGADSRVGVVGWKTYASRTTIEVPSFLVDELRRATGPGGLVENATDVLIDASDGLRVINEAEQLAAFEWAACQTSAGVRNLLTGLQPGMTEREAVRLLRWDGTPLSCHLMLTAGPRARYGLLSPGDRPIERGDPLTTAFGIWGALNCRAGFVVEDADQLPEDIADYVDRLVAPYFAAVAEWYSALHVGQSGGQLHAIVQRHLGDPFFGIFLNPGHQLHLDEWVNSPVFAGSTMELRSGMALQCDIIPATGTPYFTTNIEDGVALADESLRAELSSRVPGGVVADRGAPALHDRRARDRPAPRRPAAVQPRRPPPPVPPPPGPGHAPGRLTPGTSVASQDGRAARTARAASAVRTQMSR